MTFSEYRFSMHDSTVPTTWPFGVAITFRTKLAKLVVESYYFRTAVLQEDCNNLYQFKQLITRLLMVHGSLLMAGGPPGPTLPRQKGRLDGWGEPGGAPLDQGRSPQS